jgi:hypothetical protein
MLRNAGSISHNAATVVETVWCYYIVFLRFLAMYRRSLVHRDDLDSAIR